MVYPKLAQSKGSGDRMYSPDLFWGGRKVSAAPSPSAGPGPRESVPQARGMAHLSKVLCCKLTRRPPVSPSPLSPFGFVFGDTILALATHPFSVVAPAGRTCVRDQPENSDAFRRACRYRQAVFGERVVPALRVHRCWRAAGLQPIRRRPLRPLFSCFSLDTDFLLLLWDIDIQPKFGELFGCI